MKNYKSINTVESDELYTFIHGLKILLEEQE